MILTGYCHGLRASEICMLEAAQIRDGVLTVKRLKGSLKTVQPLVEGQGLFDEKAAIESWLATKPQGRLFSISRQQFWNVFRMHCRAAGIPERLAHPHVLKHSRALHKIKSAGIENVRQYLGHKSIASTGAYLKVSDEQASAAMAGL
jgi:site-specific recombinase XerD